MRECARKEFYGEEETRMNEEKREDIHFATTKDGYPQLNKKDLILSLAILLLCGCILSGAIPPSFSLFAGMALFAYMIIAVRNAGAIIQLSLISVCASVLTLSFVGGVAVLAIMVGTGVLAWLLITLPKYKWAPIGLLAIAYGLGALATSNLITPLLALVFLPAAALMAWAHVRDLGRTSTVLHAVLGFIVSILAALCIALWKIYGSVDYDLLVNLINQAKDLFVSIGVQTGTEMWEVVEIAAMQSETPAESMEILREAYAQVFSETNLRILADTFVGLAPALIGIPTLIISYLADVVLLSKHYNSEWRSRMTQDACTLTISPTAGVIYFVCMIIVLFVNKQSLFLMTVNNMCLLLLPGLSITGINVIIQNIRHNKGWKAAMPIVLLASAVCCMGFSSLYFIALWGAYATISAALHKKIIQKMKDQNNQDER